MFDFSGETETTFGDSIPRIVIILFLVVVVAVAVSAIMLTVEGIRLRTCPRLENSR